MTPGPNAPEEFDPADALRLLADQEAKVRAALDVRLHEQFAAWGLAWVFGLGVIWLQVRRQEPYAGPTAATAAFFGILLLIAGALTAVRTRQATAGISGSSDWQGSLYGVGWGLGFLAHFALAGALVRAGAPATAMGVQGVVGSLVVVGLMYLFGAAVWGVRPMAVLGAWLLIVAAGAGFAGPVTAALIGAVLGGGGFLAAAGWLTVSRR